MCECTHTQREAHMHTHRGRARENERERVKNKIGEANLAKITRKGVFTLANSLRVKPSPAGDGM